MLFQFLCTRCTHNPSERGAVAAEYAVLMALIIIAMIATIQALTNGITNTLTAIIGFLP